MAQIQNVRISLGSRTTPFKIEHDPQLYEAYDAYLQRELKAKLGTAEILRWAVVGAKKDGFQVSLEIEATILEGANFPKDPYRKEFSAKGNEISGPLFMHIVPTGVKAAIGGSLGDALPVNLVLSRLGTLLTHPNTCNAGPLNFMDPLSTLYCEGKSLDDFARGRCFVEPLNSRQGGLLRQNKIAIILDDGMDEWSKQNVLYQINAFRAHTGAEILGCSCIWTKAPIGGHARKLVSGAFVGDVENIDTLFDAVEEVRILGAEAVAIFTHIEVDEDHLVEYFKGEGANPFGGHEAIISHTVLSLLGIPAAHAPVLNRAEIDYVQTRKNLSPEAAGEGAAPFYTYSVLRGLQYAPQLVSSEARRISRSYALAFTSVSVILCPASSVGGVPMMRAHQLGIPIIGVKENTTVLDVTSQNIGFKDIIVVENYLEAIGLFVHVFRTSGEIDLDHLQKAKRERSPEFLSLCGHDVAVSMGVDPTSLRRPLNSIF